MNALRIERLAAAALLGLLQVATALARGGALFLTSRERLEFALATLLGIAACVLISGVLVDAASHSARPRAAFALASAALGAWAGWLLTDGRRVRDLALRPVAVGLFALLVGAGLFAALRALARLRSSRGPGAAIWRGAWACVALACLAADTWVLPRGYPAFHAGLFALALVSAALGSGLDGETRALAPRRVALGAVLLALGAPGALWFLARQPNASYATRETAPFTAKLLWPFARLSESAAPPMPAAQLDTGPVAPVARGVDLRDRDVLLITVDALRADMLRAWGGRGLTPELDQLAEQSFRFRRAYTPAPHTSYALASLLTAKFIKPVTELGRAQDHATLPDLLKRYGYRTAAFYPPAVFFVDGARFQALQSRGFGFEYRKEMFASAEQRVEQLQRYLSQAEPNPLFVWMHLFEPHEPYEPPPELATVDSARGRYEGEVRSCDRAIAKLVQAFRSARPLGTVIVSADHGEEFGDHGGNYHGSTLFEEQVHVPLIWSSPGKVAPGVSDVPVELVDVGSTILSTAGIPRDARMRGDDLSGVLAQNHPGPKFAFASVEERHMVTDGRYKTICSASEPHCQLFDLRLDPQERRNLAGEQPQRVAEMRAQLFAFLGSIAQREVVGVEQGVGFPEPLVRARLSAPGAGPDVIPLLQDARPVVRAASARVLGELKTSAALAPLATLRERDPDPAVRDEAAVASLLLGDASAREAVAALLTREDVPRDGLALPRRAALALSAVADPRAIPVLSVLLSDRAEQESERLRAVEALARIAHADAAPALIAALSQVRLRVAAARALGAIGGSQAADALWNQLREERYEPARGAEAEALVKLGDRRVAAQIQRFLGMETSIPGGVKLLLELGGARGHVRVGALLTPGQRRGTWQCSDSVCVPGPGARLAFGVSGVGRATLVIDAEPDALLWVGDHAFRCAGGEQQVSFMLAPELPVRSEGRVQIGAWALTPVSAEIPPPPPEPWDAGGPEVSPDAGAR